MTDPLDYRNVRDDRRPIAAGNFIFGLFVGFFWIGFAVYQHDLHRRLTAMQAATLPAPPGPMAAVAWFMGAVGAGIAVYFLVSRRRRTSFWPGLFCGLCITCLLAGICAVNP